MFRRTRTTAMALCAALLVAGCTRLQTDDTGAAATDSTAAPAPETFAATLTSVQQPQPVVTGASGSAQFTVAADGSIQYAVTVANLSSAPTGAHIHGPAAPGATAGAIVRFALADSATSGQIAAGSITGTAAPGITLDSLKVLMRTGMAYVQVHTVTHGSGEIAGVIGRR